MKLKVKITKEILEKSMLCNTELDFSNKVGENCAIGLAINQLIKDCWVSTDCIVSSIKMFELKNKKDYEFKGVSNDTNFPWRILLPKEAINFITKFDNLRNTPLERLKLPELEFEIELPQEYIDTIDISEAVEIINKSQTLELCG